MFALVDVRGTTEGSLGPAAAALATSGAVSVEGSLELPVSSCAPESRQEHYVCRFVQRDSTDVRAWYSD